ncbi:histidine kinase [Saprospiraceae bacterium]|nr:histidine kinase [Saprospiraceae bacterium]
MKNRSVDTPKWIYEVLFRQKYRVIKHILFWLFIYSDEFLSIVNITQPLESPFYLVLLEISADMIMVYLNIYYLLPRFFLNAQVFTYGLLTLLSVLAIMFFNGFLYDFTLEDYYDPAYVVSFIVSNSSIIMMGVAFKLTGMIYRSQVSIQDLKETNLQTELAYLKNQVNPHFLFNTLNNLFIMSKKVDKKTPDAILQLSDLLRYQLYDCESDFVNIEKELEYLNNYIELEKLRRQDIDVQMNVHGNIGSAKIRPLILIPFVENAFKYNNTGGTGSAYIYIEITQSENQFHFTCKNNVGIIKASEVGGIGLANATRRLELAYPDSHSLTAESKDGEYSVDLKIDNQ